jgi:hypothetical protein
MEQRGSKTEGRASRERKENDMNNTDDKTSEQIRQAIAAYGGPVTRCPPGEARAKLVKGADDAKQWLKQHRNDEPVADPKEERRQMRMARMRRERIAKRNAPPLKRINKHRG